MNRVTYLSRDYNITGIGYFLFQKHWCPVESGPNCGENNPSRIVIYKGRRISLLFCRRRSSSTDMRVRILQDVYIDLLVTVGDQPLVKMFSDQVLENIKPPRLFAFKEKSLMYRFRMKHVPGKLNASPDWISRYSTLSEHSWATTIDTIQQIWPMAD